MWVFDPETLFFLDVNDAAVQHYAYSRQEFLSMKIVDIRPTEDVPELLRQTKVLRPQGPSTGACCVTARATERSFSWRLLAGT